MWYTKFHLDHCTLSSPWGKKLLHTNSTVNDEIFNLGGSSTHPQFTDQGQIWTMGVYSRSNQISSKSVYCFALWGGKNKFGCIFTFKILWCTIKWCRHKVQHSAQLQIFMYPMIPKCLWVPNGEIVFTNFTIQNGTEKIQNKKHGTFFDLWWRAKSEIYQTWHSDRQSLYHACTLKTFSDSTYSFTVRWHWKICGKMHPELNPIMLAPGQGFTSHSTQNRSFRRHSPNQSLGLVWKKNKT